MTSTFLFKTGAIALLILGLLHLMAHFSMAMTLEPPPLMIEMEDYKIALFGEHSLLQFHNGYSIMMGIMLAAFGIQNFYCVEFILQNKKAFLSTILITATAFAVALIFFHVLAFGLLFLSAACYLLAWFRVSEAGQNNPI